MSTAGNSDGGQLVLAYPLPGVIEPVRASGFRIAPWPQNEAETASLVNELAPEIEAAIVIGPVPLPPGLLEAAPRLKLIICLGAGYEAHDPQALAARGIRFANTGHANSDDVAELAICLLLAARRRLVDADRLIRAGAWRSTRTGRNRGRKLGILGLGGIGRSVAVRMEAFGMEIGWFGPNRKPVPWPYFDDPVALANWADDLVVTARPTSENTGLVNAAVLEALGPQGILVNVARGSLVDEPALIAALKAGRIGGAGLDVFAQEPTDPELWADLPNVVLSPHVGGATPEAMADMLAVAITTLRLHFAGEPPPNPLN